MLSAELAYIFRHGLIRDGAYQLQLPSERAKRHELAFYLIEAVHGGRDPEAYAFDDQANPEFEAHSTDIVAMDLAEHLDLALKEYASDEHEMTELHKLYLRRSAEHAEREYSMAAAVQAWGVLVDLVVGDSKAWCFERLGRAQRQCFNNVEAEFTFKEGLEVARQCQNKKSEGSLLGNLASLYASTGRAELAERWYGQALQTSREIGDQRTEGANLGNLAILHKETGRTELAEQGFEQAIQLLRDVGDQRTEGIHVGNLANIYKNSGQIKLAEQSYLEALQISRRVGDRQGEGISLGNLAALYTSTGRPELAEHHYGQALQTSREIGDRLIEGYFFCEQTILFISTNRVTEADESWARGCAILKEHRGLSSIEKLGKDMKEACAKAGIEPFDLPGV